MGLGEWYAGSLTLQVALFLLVRVITLVPMVAVAIVLAIFVPLPRLTFPFQEIVGLALILVAKVSDYQAIKAFKEAGGSFYYTHAPPKLVTWGPYRRTRNPLYLTLFTDAFGLFVIFGSISYLVMLVIIMIGINRVVTLREEPRLMQRFGEAYLEYRKTTPRWI